MRGFSLVAVIITLASLSACGGGGGSGSFTPGGSGSPGGGGSGGLPSGPNVASLVVDKGPANFPATNTPYVTVTICAPGTSNCQTIDHVEVDTASYGLRIISSVINPTLLTAMPAENAGGGTITECTIFGDGYSWGTMRTADVQIASEKAFGLPVQIIGDSNNPVPDPCKATVGTEENTADQFGANGIVGVGPFAQDCGTACASGNGATDPQFYYSCPTGGGTCTPTAVVVTQQATNPVVKFTTDNNGVIIKLPSIADSGATTATGSLIFGIDTQSNNMLNGATVLTTDSAGFITTVYKGSTFQEGFIDSGSNLMYFTDGQIATCSIGGGANNTFFCPATELTLTAQNIGKNNTPSTVTFKVANAQTLFTNNASFTAFSNVAAPPFASATQSQTFDFGLPFFFGRTVFTAIEGMNTSGGMGPYFAY